MSEAAIVLCGGFSRRMGRDKASLPFGPETLLQRTIRTVSPVVPEVLLVAREGQVLPHGLDAVRDPAEGLGPLAGIRAGLEAMHGDVAFVTACDAPFLRPALVRRLLDLSKGYDAAVPLVGGFHMTTCAVYAKSALPAARRLLDARRLRPLFLVEAVRARIVSPEELRDVDPDLGSFRNCNTPEEYEQALAEAASGKVRIELFGIARLRAGAAGCEVIGASLEEALRALEARFPGLSPDVVRDGALTEQFVVSLNGERFLSSPRAPLVPGDTLLVLGAQAGG